MFSMEYKLMINHIFQQKCRSGYSYYCWLLEMANSLQNQWTLLQDLLHEIVMMNGIRILVLDSEIL